MQGQRVGLVNSQTKTIENAIGDSYVDKTRRQPLQFSA